MSFHINKQITLKDFDNLQIAFIIKKNKKLFSSKMWNHLFIIKDILKKITKDKFFIITDVTIDIEFKVALTCFIRMVELTYITVVAIKATLAITSLTKLDISFVEEDQYAILRLK